MINDEEEYEVEDILAHRQNKKTTEYLVRFLSYGPEDDLWLPEKNLQNAPEIIQEYWNRQNQDMPPDSVRTTRSRAKKNLSRRGHIWAYNNPAQLNGCIRDDTALEGKDVTTPNNGMLEPGPET